MAEETSGKQDSQTLRRFRPLRFSHSVVENHGVGGGGVF